MKDIYTFYIRDPRDPKFPYVDGTGRRRPKVQHAHFYRTQKDAETAIQVNGWTWCIVEQFKSPDYEDT